MFRFPGFMMTLIVLALGAPTHAQHTAAKPAINSADFAAGGAQGLWVVHVDHKASAFRTLYRPAESPAGVIRPALKSAGLPLAVAGTSARLDLIYDARTAQSITYRFDAQLGVPRFDVTQLPPLPAGVRIIQLAAAYDGPLLLGERTGDETDWEPWSLYRVTGTRWQPIDMPEGLEPRGVKALLAPQTKDDPIVLLYRTAAGRAVRYALSGDKWESRSYQIDLPGEYELIRAFDHEAVVDRPDPAGPLRVRVLLADRVLDAGLIDVPKGATSWWTTAMDDKLSVVFPGETITVAQRDLREPKDRAATVTVLKEEPWPATAANQRMITYGMMFVLLVAMFVALRPSNRISRASLPETIVLARLSQRGLATVIDLLPGVVVSMFMYEIVDPRLMFALFMDLSGNWSLKTPVVTAAGLMLVHTTISEIYSGTTLGKRIMHIRVVNYELAPPNANQALIRNIIKMLELIFWPLLIGLMLAPVRQRLGDQAARTLVISTRPAEPENADESTPSGGSADGP